jgi:GT2 family glycosyltransferase
VGQYDTVEEIFWASGAALFIRSAVFHQLGGFDEYFFAHQEEIDLCWRVKRAGYKIFIVPSSVVYHVGGGTLPAGNARKVYLNFRNNLAMLVKNLDVLEKIFKIPVRLLLDNLAAMQALIKGDVKTFTSIQKAHVDFIKCNFVLKKKNHLAKRKLTKFTGVYDGSIVKKFFIEKKKTFSEIVAFKK